MNYFDVNSFYYIDQLSIIMFILISLVVFIVASFSKRYLKGDSGYNKFFANLILLLMSSLSLVAANHLLIFLISWSLSNFFLVKLMIHKSNWKAAYNSGIFAAKNFALAFILLVISFFAIYQITGQVTIKNIVGLKNEAIPNYAILLIIIAAFIQSAIWPFNKWLLSSLNSPTPVSALMHAGLVNGGGFILARFAPLYLGNISILNFIFIAGFISAFLGIIYKLMQSDVKRMLACSTMGQMGFMVCGAGLGLLPAAVSHLFWHGFYKAYLFLASSSIVQEKRLDKRFNLEIGNFFFSIIIALIATFLFTFISNKSIVNLDSSLVLVSVIFIAASQLSLIILQSKPFRNFAKALFAAVIIAIFYGYSVHLVEDFLQPLKINEPTELNILHYIALLILFSSWLITLMAKSQNFQKTMPNWLLPVYVKLLNSSAPNKNTITTSRKSYKF